MTSLNTQTSQNSLSETYSNLSDQDKLIWEQLSKLKQLKSNQLLDLAKATEELKKRPKTQGPGSKPGLTPEQQNDELHIWIKENLGYDIPRKKVCPDHQAPFDFLSDLYFERVTSAIAIANRGGSKTMISAILHLLNSLFKPGCESAQVGAVEQQAQRAYGNLKVLLKRHGKVDVHDQHPMVTRSIQRSTEFTNGSILEVLIGTPEGVNGPHPQKVGTDEAELMELQIYQESRNMSQSKKSEDGEVTIMAQDWVTSTRKRAHGMMQMLLDENIEAERAGADPPYTVYTWCVFESAAPVPNCQVANPGCDSPCSCDRVMKGVWDDGSPRRFNEICNGRLAQSGGYLDLHDLHKTFRSTNQETYDAQQLCDKPETAGLVFPTFEKSRHGIKWWEPDPDYGKIYQGVDWGTTNPAAVVWFQVLDFDVYAYGYFQARNEDPAVLVKAGTRIAFDEIYKADMGNVELAEKVVAREKLWKKQYPTFRVVRRFVDVQGLGIRRDWARNNPPLITSWFATRDIKEQIKICRELIREDRFKVDTTRCEMFCDEAESYHYPKKKLEMVDDPEVPVDDFNHAMSAFRYAMINLHVMDRKRITTGKGNPQSSEHGHITGGSASSAPRYLPRTDDKRVAQHPLAGRVIA